MLYIIQMSDDHSSDPDLLCKVYADNEYGALLMAENANSSFKHTANNYQIHYIDSLSINLHDK